MLAAAVDSVDRRSFEASTPGESGHWNGTGNHWWVERSVVVVARPVVLGAGTTALHIETNSSRMSSVKSMEQLGSAGAAVVVLHSWVDYSSSDSQRTGDVLQSTE